jgi:hypothetical protein
MDRQCHPMDLSSFRHWSSRPIKKIRHVCHGEFDLKPRGLYFAPHEDWIKWCYNEPFWPQPYRCEHRLQDGTKLNIMKLTTANEAKFRQEYSANVPAFLNQIAWVDWRKVALDYDGVHIPLDLVKQFAWKMYDVETLVIWKGAVSLTPLRTVTSSKEMFAICDPGAPRTRHSTAPYRVKRRKRRKHN